MTIIFGRGNIFWIEVFAIPRTTIATGATKITTHTLERQGQFLTAFVTPDSDVAQVTGMIRNVDNSVLAIGDDITNLESVMQNNNAGNAELGGHVIIFLRGRGG